MTPVTNTVIVAIAASLLAAFIPLQKLADMVSIGTLTAFIVVSVGVIILRVREPDLPRGVQGARLPCHSCAFGAGVRVHPRQLALVHLDRVQRLGHGGADLLPGVGPPPQRAQRAD